MRRMRLIKKRLMLQRRLSGRSRPEQSGNCCAMPLGPAIEDSYCERNLSKEAGTQQDTVSACRAGTQS